MLGEYLAKSSKNWNLMTIVLREWGLTTESAETEMKFQYEHYLDAKNLNLHHEKM